MRRGLLLRWLILTLSILAASYLIGGIYVRGFFSAFFTAAVLGILNAFLRPILFILTLPLNILTLGLFTFVINAFLLKLASGVLAGFVVVGFWPAVFGALVISIVNWLVSSLLTRDRRLEGRGHIDLHRRDGDRWE